MYATCKAFDFNSLLVTQMTGFYYRDDDEKVCPKDTYTNKYSNVLCRLQFQRTPAGYRRGILLSLKVLKIDT